MNHHIVAIDSYGKQRVKDPRTGRSISAYKIGYSGEASRILLMLYGQRASDVT